MPGWEVHLSVSLTAVLSIATGFSLGLYQGGLSFTDLEKSFPLIQILCLGFTALIVGSVLPDMDGKGRIRWTMGPVLGVFGILPPFMGSFTSEGPIQAFSFLWEEGARLFLVLTAAGYLIILLPMKHRGWMHSITPGAVFGAAFGSYVFISTSLGWEGAVLIAVLGILGYLWHLSLDGELSL
jgi:membrane-bound metal-dependent hydrolase YbcI (DUF457 family)